MDAAPLKHRKKFKNIWEAAKVRLCVVCVGHCYVKGLGFHGDVVFAQRYENPPTGSSGHRAKPQGYDRLAEVLPRDMPRRSHDTAMEAGVVSRALF